MHPDTEGKLAQFAHKKITKPFTSFSKLSVKDLTLGKSVTISDLECRSTKRSDALASRETRQTVQSAAIPRGAKEERDHLHAVLPSSSYCSYLHYIFSRNTGLENVKVGDLVNQIIKYFDTLQFLNTAYQIVLL